jgi:hypothetical protein
MLLPWELLDAGLHDNEAGRHRTLCLRRTSRILVTLFALLAPNNDRLDKMGKWNKFTLCPEMLFIDLTVLFFAHEAQSLLALSLSMLA